jgi:lipoic acid synthetase
MGSIIWVETVKAIRRMNPTTTLETLISDFQGGGRKIYRQNSSYFTSSGIT